VLIDNFYFLEKHTPTHTHTLSHDGFNTAAFAILHSCRESTIVILDQTLQLLPMVWIDLIAKGDDDDEVKPDEHEMNKQRASATQAGTALDKRCFSVLSHWAA